MTVRVSNVTVIVTLLCAITVQYEAVISDSQTFAVRLKIIFSFRMLPLLLFYGNIAIIQVLRW